MGRPRPEVGVEIVDPDPQPHPSDDKVVTMVNRDQRPLRSS